MRILVNLLVFSLSWAQGSTDIWTGSGQSSSFSEMIDALATHRVIVLGENHGFKTHQAQHLEILQALKNRGLKVHVGMEFFSFPDQNWVDLYHQGQMSEGEFLKTIKWGSPSFEYYRSQVLLGERAWALNAPRFLTSRIVQVGLEGLSDEEKVLLPPAFELGNKGYRARFLEAMGGHITDPAKFERYFTSQSLWDDTMAWRAQQILNSHPEITLVIIVGEFHVQYGGGLPDRLRNRGVQSVATVSQVNTSGMTQEETHKATQPDAEYGPRADWIWSAPAVD